MSGQSRKELLYSTEGNPFWDTHTAQMEFEYDQQAWLEDWDLVLEASLETPAEKRPARLHRFFHARYTNPLEAEWKCERVLMAYRYLDEYLESFERRGLAIGSKKRATIGGCVAIMLWGFFGCVSDEQVKNPPSPEILIAASEIRKEIND
jgi:hypothetical protein